MQETPIQIEPDDPGLTTPSGDLVRDIQSLLLTFSSFEYFPSAEELPILIGPGWNNALDECIAAKYIGELAQGGLALTKLGETVASELAADDTRRTQKGVDDDGKESIEEGGKEGEQTGGGERATTGEGPKVGKDNRRNRAKGQRRHKARRSE